jgi:translocation and assembly module TamB
VRAEGRGRLSNAPVSVPVIFTAKRVTGIGDVAGGILANLRVQGLLKVTARELRGEGLTLTSDKLKSRISLFVDLVNGRYDVVLSGGLSRYLIPGLGIVDVTSELKVVPNPAGRGTLVTGKGRAWVRRFDNRFLLGLAGGLPQIETDLVRTNDGIVRFVNLRLTAPAIRIAGSGFRRKDGTFFFEGSGAQNSYGPFALRLDGRIDRPQMAIKLARPNDAMGLANVLLDLDPTGRASLTGRKAARGWAPSLRAGRSCCRPGSRQSSRLRRSAYRGRMPAACSGPIPGASPAGSMWRAAALRAGCCSTRSATCSASKRISPPTMRPSPGRPPSASGAASWTE